MTQRKGHVIRVFKDGDTSSNSWVDVLRLDQIPTIQNGGGQVKFYGVTKWKDDSGAGDGKSDNPIHITEQVKVKDDSGSTICEVPATKAMVLRQSGQEVIHYFRNDKDTNSARQVQLVRVYPANVDVDPTTPMDWEEYKAALQSGDPDTSQWITMAVPLTWQTKQQQGATYQGQGVKYKNRHELVDVLNNFEETDDDTDAVWLDPLSVIVNWSGGGGTPATYTLFMGTYVVWAPTYAPDQIGLGPVTTLPIFIYFSDSVLSPIGIPVYGPYTLDVVGLAVAYDDITPYIPANNTPDPGDTYDAPADVIDGAGSTLTNTTVVRKNGSEIINSQTYTYSLADATIIVGGSIPPTPDHIEWPYDLVPAGSYSATVFVRRGPVFSGTTETGNTIYGISIGFPVPDS